jgi:propionate CoA-transferase
MRIVRLWAGAWQSDSAQATSFLRSGGPGQVSQITFSGRVAAESGQQVLYVTERCVFKLTRDGLELIEVAPGVDIEQDVLACLPFKPIVRDVRAMDPSIFREDTMGLRDALLNRPLHDRLSYDARRNALFLDFEGLRLRSAGEIDALRDAVAELCRAAGRRVDVVVNYAFELDADLEAYYAQVTERLELDHYMEVARYTSSAFMRLKLNQVLAGRVVRPPVFPISSAAKAPHASAG